MKEGGEWYAFTQFESISARRAFPCFDAPVACFPAVAAGLCRAEARREMEGFFMPRAAAVAGGPRALDQALEAVGDQALEAVGQCLARKRVQEPSLAAWLRSRGGAVC